MLAFTGELSFLTGDWKDVFLLGTGLLDASSLIILWSFELDCEPSLVLSSLRLDTPSLLFHH